MGAGERPGNAAAPDGPKPRSLDTAPSHERQPADPMTPDTNGEVVTLAQQFIATHGPAKHGVPIQRLLDAVSGIPGYRMDTRYDQGFIHRRFSSERISNNHIVDYDALVSSFWQGVFKYLPKAQPVGTTVDVRDGELVDMTTVEISLRHQHGRTYQMRATKMPPIKYLQMQGTTAARKYVNSCYKTRLRQQCSACGRSGNIGATKELDNGCPKCGSTESLIIGGVMRRRTRKCRVCEHVRACVMKRVCGSPKEAGCGSVDVQVVQSEEYLTTHESWDATLGADGHDPEIRMMAGELERDAQEFVRACADALPRDARDPQGDSQSRKILRILVDPASGKDICTRCAENAPRVCADKCTGLDCIHDRIPDPKVCCGAASFSMDECVNYSKRIGEFLGYTASLANRRVTKVRKHALEFAQANGRRFMTARYISRRLGAET